MRHNVWQRGRLAILVLLLVLGGLAPVGMGGGVAQAAVGTPGTLLAWGYDNTGQIGDGTVGNPDANPTPKAISGLTGIVAVAAGGFHNLALKEDGTVLAWGSDYSGQLGDGTISGPTATPTAVPGVTGVVAIDAGTDHSLALKGDGTVLAWGSDADGQLGDGTAGSGSATPVVVPGVTGIKAISAGGSHNLALKEDGTLLAWGADGNGQLGDGSSGGPDSATPKAVPGVTGIKAISAGYGHNLALKEDGTLLAWGSDTFGELGDGTVRNPFSESTPKAVPGVTGIKAISAGNGHSLALKEDGTVLAWGSDSNGQLGDGTAVGNSATPTAVPGVTGIVAIAAGSTHSLAVKEDGTLLAWGNDTNGQLGDGAVDDTSATPKLVPDVINVVAVVGGYSHTLAIIAAPSGPATVTLEQSTGGTATITPPGPYVVGQLIEAKAVSDSGMLFIGWQGKGVVSNTGARPSGTQGAPIGAWDNPFEAEVTAKSVVLKPIFVAIPNFGDVGHNNPAANAINQLSARGVIKGCDSSATPPLFCPDDAILRHQMAALIVRAIPGWADETGLPTFSDNTQDTELMTRVATLQRHHVVNGYPNQYCLQIGLTPPCYGPLDSVKYGEALLFISRAMVEKGYWTLQPDDRTIFPDQNGEAGADPNTDQQTKDHRHVVTYLHYVGHPPDVADVHVPFKRDGVANGAWVDPSTRSWFARALWAALDQYFGSEPIP